MAHRLALPVYLPALLFATGQGTIIPMLPVAAVHIGASLSVASAAVAAYGIGIVSFDLPAGRLVGRVGDRRAILLGSALLSTGLVGAALSSSVVSFAACAFVLGCGQSTWLLSRLAYVSEVVPGHARGRALSAVGGITRFGNFIGPFIAAGVVKAIGIDGAFFVSMACALLGGVCVNVVHDPRPGGGVESHRTNIASTLRQHRPLFLAVGGGVMVVSILRAARQVVLPLWALHIGLGASSAGILYGLSAAADMSLSYPAGIASDRWGRRAVAIPCLLLLSIGLFFLAFQSTFVGVAAVGVVMGIGNGLGSGIVMTIGADFAPATSRAQFLSVWRVISDAGTALGPVLISVVASVAGVGVAASFISGLGVLGVLSFRTRSAATAMGHAIDALSRRGPEA